MSDSTITGGLVRIEDGKKSSTEYEPPRKVAVELRFDVAEGADAEAVLARVAKMADARVLSLLGLTPPEPVRAPVVRETEPEESMHARATESPQSRRGRPPGAKNKTTLASQPTSAASPASDAETVEEPARVDPANADLAFEPEAEDVPTITDMDLHHAVTQAKSDRGLTVDRIKNLIREFHTEEQLKQRWGIASIPAMNRAAFLAALKDLKPE